MRLSHFGMPASRVTTVAISSMRAPRPSAMRVQNLARSSGRLGGPRGEGGAGGLDGGVDVGGVAVRDAPDHLAVGGVEHVDRAGALRRHPRAVDVDLVVLLHCVAPCGGSGRTHGPVGHRRYRRVRRLRTPSLGHRLGYRPAMTEPQDPGPRSDEVSLRIEAPPEAVYAIVTDIAQMGRLSPECTGGQWLGGATGPAVGARFKGSNKRGRARWSTTNTVVEAEPGRVFSFETPAERRPLDLPHGARRRRHPRHGEPRRCSRTVRCSPRSTPRCSSAAIEDHDDEMRDGMRQTLERLKAVAESP